MGRRKRKLKKGVAAALAVLVCLVAAWAASAVLHNMKKAPLSPARESGSLASEPPQPKQEDSDDVPQASPSGAASIASNPETAAGGLLMIANKDNKIPESFSPDLVKLPSSYFYSSGKDTHFDSRAAEYLKRFIDAGRKAGFDDLCILSGYRTYAYQKSNFERHVKQFEEKGETASQAETHAAELVAPPGTSEHETGLAADIITSSWYNSTGELTAEFDTTDAFAWLQANCADYGFILRYPEDKVDKTGYEYEPWHYRFVGVENAKKIMENNLCLEEYVETLE